MLSRDNGCCAARRKGAAPRRVVMSTRRFAIARMGFAGHAQGRWRSEHRLVCQANNDPLMSYAVLQPAV